MTALKLLYYSKQPSSSSSSFSIHTMDNVFGRAMSNIRNSRRCFWTIINSTTSNHKTNHLRSVRSTGRKYSKLISGNKCFQSNTIGNENKVFGKKLMTLKQDSSFSSSDSSSLNLKLYDSLSKQVKPIPTMITTKTTIAAAKERDNGDGNNDRTTTITKQRGLAWYTCGPTTYAPTHLGHARTYLWIDVMQRIIKQVCTWNSDNNTTIIQPLFVMNITNIDDKIINAAMKETNNNINRKENDSILSTNDTTRYAKKYEELFWQDLDTLNCLRPNIVTRVSEYVESGIIPYILQLEKNGTTYVIPNDGVYFHVQHFESKMEKRYNSNTGNHKQDDDDDDQVLSPASNSSIDGDDDNIFYGRLVPEIQKQIKKQRKQKEEISQEQKKEDYKTDIMKKKDARDFCLWKFHDRGGHQNDTTKEHNIYWESPWGNGRPGWHIECSAMIESIAEQFSDTHTFYVHAGGIDLKFPHHANEMAQAEAYHLANDSTSCNGCHDHGAGHHQSTKEWIPHWVHTGHLTIGETKMSKSLSNFLTIDELWFDDPAAGADDDIGTDKKTNRRTSTPLYSPVDDFRLWVLGMSGSYTNPAEYSRDKIRLARKERQKIVRFLIESEQWLESLRTNNEHGNNSTSSSLVWKEADSKFHHFVQETYTKCIHSILDDMDGANYMKGIVQISETGYSYLNKKYKIDNSDDNSNIQPLVEPIKMAIEKVRYLLSIIGFTDHTTRAGIMTTMDKENDNNLIIGGEGALVEEIVQFRSKIRQAALRDMKRIKKEAKAKKKKNDADNSRSTSQQYTDDSTLNTMNEILSLCDNLRDDIFPSMGIQIMDDKTKFEAIKENNHKKSNGNLEKDGNINSKAWRYIVPTNATDSNKNSRK